MAVQKKRDRLKREMAKSKAVKLKSEKIIGTCFHLLINLAENQDVRVMHSFHTFIHPCRAFIRVMLCVRSPVYSFIRVMHSFIHLSIRTLPPPHPSLSPFLPLFQVEMKMLKKGLIETLTTHLDYAITCNLAIMLVVFLKKLSMYVS